MEVASHNNATVQAHQVRSISPLDSWDGGRVSEITHCDRFVLEIVGFSFVSV
jgi:hypothetical protein